MCKEFQSWTQIIVALQTFNNNDGAVLHYYETQYCTYSTFFSMKIVKSLRFICLLATTVGDCVCFIIMYVESITSIKVQVQWTVTLNARDTIHSNHSVWRKLNLCRVGGGGGKLIVCSIDYQNMRFIGTYFVYLLMDL